MEGTPVPVDFARDRPGRAIWVVLLAGPVIWISHFMVVYLAAEAGCTGDGPGLELFDPPVPRVVTLSLTVVAAIACVPFAVWAFRWWRRKPRRGAGGQRADVANDVADRASTGFAGLVLSSLSIFAILAVGLTAAFLGC